MKMINYIHIIFISNLLLVISSCVPKATEKTASCSAGTAFNSVTRSCENSVAARTRPNGTLASDTLNQETAKTITLTYKDGNNNSAISCKVSNLNSNIEAISPQITNGAFFYQAGLVIQSVNNIINNMPTDTPAHLADKTTISNERDAMTTALNTAKKIYDYSGILNQFATYKLNLDNLLTLVSSYTNLYSTVKFYYDQTQTQLVVYQAMKVYVDNRCNCSGGVCTTIIAPRINQSGVSGFSYTITDIDGEGDPSAVNLTINPLPVNTTSLQPAVESSYVTFTESATNTPGTYSFSLPIARDYFSTSSFGYTYNGTISGGYGITSLGKVSGCMNLTGSTGPYNTSCLYTPNTGDTYDTVTPITASVVIGDLTFTAKSAGSFANNYSIQYFDLQNNNLATDPYSTSLENFGLVLQNYNNSYLRVVGNSIRVFFNSGVTSSSDIKNLINADAKAKSMVIVTGGSTATFPDPAVLAASAISLSGGSDAFDKLSFTANNGNGTSSDTANVMIKMNHVDHAPLTPTEYNIAYMPLVLNPAATIAQAEGLVNQTIILPYKDSDNNPGVFPVTCAIDFTTPPNMGLKYFGVSTCTCDVAGVCSANVVSDTPAYANLNGTSKFSYTITTQDNFAPFAPKTSGAQSVGVSVWEVNNPPVLTATSATTIVSGVPAAGNLLALSVPENSTAAPSSAYICFTATSGGGTDELSQSLSISATQVAPVAPLILTFGSVLAPGAVGNNCAGANYMVSFSSAQNQSGSTNIKIAVTDNGTTHGAADPQTVFQIIPLTITMVNDPPYFTSAITTVDTNEGGMVVAGPFKIDEDQGGSLDENAQAITITSITSDNPAVLSNASTPRSTSPIKIFYDLNDNGVEDSGEARDLSQGLETLATDDSNAHAFYLKLYPVASVSGNANITITATDGTTAVTKIFSLIVHPVAAIHGGWTHISAIGIKTDKNGAPATPSDVQCNFNQSAAGAPNGTVTPSMVNSIYKDTSSGKCYRSQSTSVFSWVDLTTTCPITYINITPTTLSTSIASGDLAMTVASTAAFPSKGILTIGQENILYTGTTATTFTGLTRGYNSTTAAAHTAGVSISYTANFIEDLLSAIPPQSTPIPTAMNQYYYKVSDKTCHISTQTGPNTWGWDATAFVPAKITLSWNTFNVTGASVLGWNVYRRENGHDYDYVNGFLKPTQTDMTIGSATTRTFTDTTAVAGKVYYYLVRPVDNSGFKRSISTPEVFSEVRVLAPAPNYAFVHRWMANQEVCNSMHMTTATTALVDQNHNYRCPYRGPGESVTSPGYYDIGKDMLVDISESGCPYTAAPKCDPVNGCVDIGDPTTLLISADKNNIYYDRSTGSCYVNTSVVTGVSWANINTAVSAAVVVNTNTALNAPLTNISESSASSVCTARSSSPSFTAATANLTGLISTPLLPTKKEYIAYSAAPVGMTDSLITPLEEGASLDVQSRCNSSSASGLTAGFSDSHIPSSSFIYSIAGTATSGIRSLYTGSTYTAACSSRYGIQDVYGNVAEWVQDSMTCDTGASGHYTCTATGGSGSDLGSYDFDTATSSGKKYGFNYLTGPYNDANGSSDTTGVDAFLTNWIFRDKPYGASKFSFPVGMPINIDIATAGGGGLANSLALTNLLDIGPTSGITSTQLHEDGIIVNGVANETGYFAQGGSYLSGNLAGRYTSELVPSTATTRPDVGFRCYIPIDKTNYFTDANHTYSY